MSDDLAERLEILVHSAAPTSKKEDDRIRAQALACLGFQPAKKTSLTDITFTRDRIHLVKGGRRSPQKPRNSRTRSQTRKSREENSQLQVIETTEHVKVALTTKFTSRITKFTPVGSLKTVGCNVESSENHVVEQVVDAKISPIIFTSSEKSSFHLEDSQNLPAPHEDKPPSNYATSRFDPWKSSHASIPNPQPLKDALSLPIIPSSEYPTIPAEDGVEEAESPDRPMFPTLSGTSFGYAPLPPTFSSLGLASSHPENSPALSEYSLTSLHSSYPPSPRLLEFNPSCALRSHVDGPYEFFSPTPTTSSNPPLVTRLLRNMTEFGGKQLTNKYQALKKSQIRDLREWERGHWNVDTSSWKSVKVKIHFWGMLKDNVVSGRLGPVSVFLDDDEGDAVKIYCFGGMAENLWRTLFVMSSRNLENVAWIDAANKEIIKF